MAAWVGPSSSPTFVAVFFVKKDLENLDEDGDSSLCGATMTV
jgi:hypothetical protein